MNSRAEENYLKALFLLSQDNEDVALNELSKTLDVKMPTATGMMKKFSQKAWVIYQSYKPIRLTEKGRKEAASIVRKHRLTEMFLADKMGLGWESVHEIAEQIEHIKSPLFFDKMDEMLDYPKLDPHGSPIPDKNGNIQELNYISLSEVDLGAKVIFRAVHNATDEFLKFLNNKSISLHNKLEVIDIEAFDNSITIKYNGKTTILSKEACERMLVEIISMPK